MPVVSFLPILLPSGIPLDFVARWLLRSCLGLEERFGLVGRSKMSVNFFSWIRDGVKQSVLLGVSDAIEVIGAPEDPQSMHPSVAALLQNRGKADSSTASPRLSGANDPGRSKKRLGRSLKDIDIKPAS